MNVTYVLKIFIFQIDSDNVKWVAKQIARALAYMHGQDPIVIHQDLKPANVMVRTSIDMQNVVNLLHSTGRTQLSRICV